MKRNDSQKLKTLYLIIKNKIPVFVQIIPRATKFSGGIAFQANRDLPPRDMLHTFFSFKGCGKTLLRIVLRVLLFRILEVALSVNSTSIYLFEFFVDAGLMKPGHA